MPENWKRVANVCTRFHWAHRTRSDRLAWCRHSKSLGFNSLSSANNSMRSSLQLRLVAHKRDWKLVNDCSTILTCDCSELVPTIPLKRSKRTPCWQLDQCLRGWADQTFREQMNYLSTSTSLAAVMRFGRGSLRKRRGSLLKLKVCCLIRFTRVKPRRG